MRAHVSDNLRFGVFDHLDDSGAPLAEFYENRLRLAEAYDRLGIDYYLTAEHHATPLGMAPSPSVFHSAVAQRTRRIRFGPLVYTLALYHPLRLAEEICMLDHMSRGRLQLGVGRGISPFELGYYGIDPGEAQARYLEGFAIVMQALAAARSAGRELSFAGRFHTFARVPITLGPLQAPHPPLWYGIGSPEGVPWCVANRCNVVSNAPLQQVRVMTDAYRAQWRAAGHADSQLPALGTTRHLVIAPSAAEANDLARRAYARWHASFMHLWVRNDAKPGAYFPATWDELVQAGRALAGTPEAVREELAAQIRQTGVNCILTRFAFGDLPFDVSLRSAELYADRVMPWLRDHAAADTPSRAHDHA
ncbi:MAG: LLM class flavin-dependent oxidoreductase [Burkholderiales bacterium]|nr:LLM class flavin-dependent oxidoreductase [Burkholderiales bacterium]